MSFDDTQMFAARSDGETSYEIVQDWRHQSLCKEEGDPDLFFPVGTTGVALLMIEEAKSVCRRCPVMEKCGNWALDNGEDTGIWGGMSEDERRTIKRRMARQRTAAYGKQKAGAQS